MTDDLVLHVDDICENWTPGCFSTGGYHINNRPDNWQRLSKDHAKLILPHVMKELESHPEAITWEDVDAGTFYLNVNERLFLHSNGHRIKCKGIYCDFASAALGEFNFPSYHMGGSWNRNPFFLSIENGRPMLNFNPSAEAEKTRLQRHLAAEASFLQQVFDSPK